LFASAPAWKVANRLAVEGHGIFGRIEADLCGQTYCRGGDQEKVTTHKWTTASVSLAARVRQPVIMSSNAHYVVASRSSSGLLGRSGPAALARIENRPTGGGSIFHIRNGSSQPLTAYLIELGTIRKFLFVSAGRRHEPMAPGEIKQIQVTNMTVGAVPDYVKMQAAIYADGTSSGIPEKITQLVERRKAVLETTRELIRRLEKISDSTAAVADLKQWTDSMQPPRPCQSQLASGGESGSVRGLIRTDIRLS